jgi:hypothetical protein
MRYQSEADSRAEFVASGQILDCQQKNLEAVWSVATE